MLLLDTSGGTKEHYFHNYPRGKVTYMKLLLSLPLTVSKDCSPVVTSEILAIRPCRVQSEGLLFPRDLLSNNILSNQAKQPVQTYLHNALLLTKGLKATASVSIPLHQTDPLVFITSQLKLIVSQAY